jgi:hypothetical protein
VPKWTIWAAGLVAVAALAACNPDSKPAASGSASPAPASASVPPGSAPHSESSSVPSSGSSEPAVAIPSDPRQAVMAAATTLGKQPFKLKFTSLGQHATGSVDPAAKVSEIVTTLDNGATITARQFGTEQFVQVTGETATALHAVPGKWMHVDTKGLPSGNPLSPDRNQAAAGANLLKNAKSVRLDGPRAYSGQVDLSRAGAAQLPSSVTSKLKAVPFTTTLDPQGRFVTLVFDLDSVVTGAGKLSSAYSDYGVPVNVARPVAGEIVAMPAAFKKAIGL